MMTRRRWIADEWNETTAALTGEQAAHLIRVLRAEPGMEFDMVAGGKLFRAVLTECANDIARFELLQEMEADGALPITLLLSVFKFDRMEWAIEKATELGVERIVPVIASRTEKHLALASAKRVERWRRIAREAAQQSRRSDVPAIEDAQPLKTALKREQAGAKLLLSESEQSVMLSAALREESTREGRALQMAFGPEGGWTQQEASLFEAEGWKSVSLGPRILRAETAAIAATAIAGAFYNEAAH